ncbi:MAG: hypothetical protein WC879_12295 [Melioribacteraceae bacterium]
MPGTLAAKRIVDPVLTSIARGYSNAALIATKLFPIVEVDKEGGKIPQFTKEAFKIYNTERAIRAKSNRINPEDKSSIDYALTEHDLEYPMDYREIEEDILNLRMHASVVVTDGIALRLEKIAADLAQDDTNYPVGNKITLAGASQFSDPTSNPFTTIDTAKDAVRAKIAKRPNVAILGASTYKALKNHPLILDRIKVTQHAIVNPDLLRQLLDLDELYIGDAVYSNDSGTFIDIWNDSMILAFVSTKQANIDRSIYEPSFAYTLRKKNYPLVDRYEEAGKLEIVRSTDIFTAKIVGSDAGYLISNCVA